MSDLRCVDELAEGRGVLARQFRLVQDYRGVNLSNQVGAIKIKSAGGP